MKAAIEKHVLEIIKDMNKLLMEDRIVGFWRKVGSHLTLKEVRDTYWTDSKSRSEFGVDMGVSFGKIFELYLPFKLKELGYDVTPRFSSKGDMKVGDTSWELKTGTGTNIQGATHSPKEKAAMNLIQVLWTYELDKSLDELESLISTINICVFENTIVQSTGEASPTNSRTAVRFLKEQYKECSDACVYGTIKENRVYAGFTKLPV